MGSADSPPPPFSSSLSASLSPSASADPAGLPAQGSAAADAAGFPALAAWLGPRLAQSSDAAVTPVDIAAPARAGVGQSGDTWLFQARWAEHGHPRTADLVLRRQPGYDGIFLRPDADREFTVIQGLARYPSVPVPRARWVERDPAVLGAPFFIMDQVPGIVPSGRPSIHVTGWLTTLTPAQRRSAWQSSIDALAALHDVPWRRSHAFLADDDALPVGDSDAPRADDAASGLARYLQHMAEWYHWAAAGRVFPVTDAALAYILEHAPGAGPSAPVLTWGDARPGNIIFDPLRCVPAALIDWEIAAIAPPEADVAHWLIFDDFATSAAGVEPLPGYATRDEKIIGRYEATSGRRLGDVGYFEIAQTLFLATTLIRQADARVKRGELPVGTRMGHDNTLTQMLARRLGLPVPELSADYLSHRAGRHSPQAQAAPSAPAARRPGMATPTPNAPQAPAAPPAPEVRPPGMAAPTPKAG
jgi:aminoglycoside phosphotransferase (APT) family kinase protein